VSSITFSQIYSTYVVVIALIMNFYSGSTHFQSLLSYLFYRSQISGFLLRCSQIFYSINIRSSTPISTFRIDFLYHFPFLSQSTAVLSLFFIFFIFIYTLCSYCKCKISTYYRVVLISTVFIVLFAI